MECSRGHDGDLRTVIRRQGLAAFLQGFSVQGIDPPQKATFARDGRIGYVFPADPPEPSVAEIKFAILEVSGNISIIKKQKSG